MAYWFGFAAVAGAFGGLIAFGVQQVGYGPYLAGIGGEWDWKVLFLIEVSINFVFYKGTRGGKDVDALVARASHLSIPALQHCIHLDHEGAVSQVVDTHSVDSSNLRCLREVVCLC